jgi:sensor histidine kinase YesM
MDGAHDSIDLGSSRLRKSLIFNNFLMQRSRRADLSFILILDVSLCTVLSGFNAWNWYLACAGFTTVEFMKKFHLRNDDVYDFSYDTVKDNLFVIFGTHKIFRILSPSMRALPFSGIEFSFQMKDEGYNEDGIIWNDSSEDEEAPKQQVEMTAIATED